MLTLKPELTLPAVGLTGFEAPLTAEEVAIQGAVHRFSKDVLRPIGQDLDKMSAADACAHLAAVVAAAVQSGRDAVGRTREDLDHAADRV